jgi:transglutaminase superfamily protein/coenzyme PQQ synthesis protein D (PqqD)
MNDNVQAVNPFRFSIAPGICFTTEEDGTAILNVDRGKFYSVIGLGSKIWDNLVASQQGLTIDDLVNSFRDDFEDATPQEIRDEIESYLNQLNQKGIICSGDSRSERFGEALRMTVNSTIVIPTRLVVHLLLRLKLNKIAAFFYLTLVDLMLAVGGFRELYRTVEGWPVINKHWGRLEAINEICGAVDKACVYYPKHALCLQRSVVAACLLRQLGIQAEMVIGCHKLPFSSHAWVEVEGIVVNDHKNVQKYYKILERI